MSREENTAADNLLFKPGILRNRRHKSPVRSVTMFDSENDQKNLTGSFRYDSPGSALKSTQQLNVDWSNFSKHTFFNSAEAKTQKAFDKIINRLPFDGTKSEFNAFLDGLSGYEKYILDSFPKSTGYLGFSGSFISVSDFKGSYNPSLSNNPTGESVIDPISKSFTFEFYINSPTEQTDNQVILQKISGTNGISLVLSSSAAKSSPTEKLDFLMMISSGSLTVSASMEIQKGQFEHVAATFDKSMNSNHISLYLNGSLASTSSIAQLGQIDFRNSPLLIGSGSAHTLGYYEFAPVETLSGALDEVRVWHEARTQSDIYQNRFIDVFSQPNLQLLYRFNEPSGSFVGDGANLVLDYSGNSLHASISNFNMNLRNTSSFGPSPVLGEKSINSVVLFPSYADVITLNSALLASASDYDYSNSNLITRLIPPHYLLEAATAEGFETEKADIGDAIVSSTDQPGGGRVGQPQIIAGLLYTFAETFDELKMFVDEFKRALNVDVITNDTVSDHLLPWLSRYYGISLPSFFADAPIRQLLDGENIRTDNVNTMSLQAVQNMLWRRVFSDLPHLFATRGTHSALKSILANMGIQPGGAIRIREFGGASFRELGDSYIRRSEIAAMLNMSGTSGPSGSLNAQGIDSARPFLQGSFLSGSRVEPGQPSAKGNIASGLSDYEWDGLFTSGSWSVEGVYKFDARLSHYATQSLSRMHVTGTDTSAAAQGVLFNLLSFSSSSNSPITGSLTLFGRPTTTSIQPLKLELTGVNIFDGQKWYVSYGRNRNDLISSYVSSSYFLRAAKFTPAGLEQFHVTSSYYDDSVGSILSSGSSQYNASGTFLVIGSQSIDDTGTAFLNDSSTDQLSRYTPFTGKVSSIRFYSLGLSNEEAKTHARNFKSLGVKDPETNFNFVTISSGSFARLRQDTNIDQPITKSDASGNISLFDFSQNQLTLAGTGFEAEKQVIDPERFDFDVLSSNFQSGENPNKVRIRSFLDSNLAETFGVSLAPLHQIPQAEEPQDDKRISVEVGVTQGLNEDIMSIFSTLNKLDNVIGSPELVFSQDYPSLRNLRRIYFNRLTDKVNLQSFFEFFKWFDDTIGDLLEQMLPSNSKFAGTSYVIESHALERAKFAYKYYDVYLGEEDRGGKDVILMQQIVGILRKM
jgi:hypothetical protein